MRRFYLLLFVLLLCAAPCAALAAQEATLWIAPAASGDEKPVDAIDWYKSGKEYWFFIPASLDMSDVRFGLDGMDSVEISGLGKVRAGDSAAALKPGKYTVRIGKKKATLHVMRGSEGLPALYITTASGSLKYIEANKEHHEAGDLVFVGPAGDEQYRGSLEHIKTRGNSSMTFVKKNYQIKLSSGANLMGFGKAKKWILTGNYRDKSYLRNQIVLDMAAYAGLPYTPEHISAEVYINHEYRGLYLFSEKVEIDDDRIDIPDLEAQTEDLNGGDLSRFPLAGSKKPVKGKYKAYEIPVEPEDLTGGYLIEYESYPTRYRQEKSAYFTRKGNVLVIKSPEYVGITQMAYISGRLQAFENAIFAEDGRDPDSGAHYTEIVDLPSLVAKYMLEEICKNYDGNSSSQYFFKPADSRSTLIYAGPAWDYDSSFGSYAQPHNADNVLSGKGMWIANNDKTAWYPRLYRRAEFREAVAHCWNTKLKAAVEILLGLREPDGSALLSIDDYAERIRDSVAMEYVRWPRLAKPSTVAQTGHTFDMNLTYLKRFLTDRYNDLCVEWAE